MPSPKNGNRRGGQEKNKKGKLSEKSSSFHGKGSGGLAETLPRPRTVPDLRAAGSSRAAEEAMGRLQPKLTKLLLNVTIQRSPGPVHVLVPPEATVEELIAASLRQYVKEARRPVLASTEASSFDLHYSQFSLESLEREMQVMELGSRNFFLCPKQTESLCSSCSKEAGGAVRKGLPWIKFMDFML